jgi:hypothetical protein
MKSFSQYNESRAAVSSTQFKKLIKDGWKAVSSEKDIPDEKGVEWVWSKDDKMFAWRYADGSV